MHFSVKSPSQRSGCLNYFSALREATSRLNMKAMSHFVRLGAAQEHKLEEEYKIASGALEELHKVLLDRGLTAGQLLSFAGPSPLKEASQVAAQLLANLPVQAAVEERVGGEAEIANPRDHIFQLGQRGGRGRHRGRVEMEGEIRQPAAEELASHRRQHRRGLPATEGPLRGGAGAGPTEACRHGGAAADGLGPWSRRVHPRGKGPVLHGGDARHLEHVAVDHENDQHGAQEVDQREEDHEEQPGGPASRPVKRAVSLTRKEN
ncbi:hypothetical protein EYF80_006888 [Liparis tanakae]|uniref:Uncharacterized protein n=1 Tax=Liparis tanakae TaxID=230148 RepID=A0A4Z2IYS0_9TELE|nr:hypothetical protein EYF80_006888 [Liparis tanakae]